MKTLFFCFLSPKSKPLRSVRFRIAFAAFAICFFNACAGMPFKTDNVARIVDGKTTRAEIDAWFNRPFRKITLKGVTPKGGVLRYVWMTGHAIPFGAKSKALVVDFDANGIVVDHAYNQETRVLTNVVPFTPGIKVSGSDKPQ